MSDVPYELTEKEKIIIQACMLRANYSSRQLETMTGISARDIKKTIKKLQESGVIHRRTYINVYPLGYIFSGLYLALNGEGIKKRKEIVHFLMLHDAVSYLAAFCDQRTLKVTTVSKNGSRVLELIKAISYEFGSVISNRTLFELERIYDYSLCLTDDSNTDDRFLSFGAVSRLEDIDELDHNILKLLTTYNAKNLKTIADKLSIPQSTLSYRMSRLADREIVCGERYILDFDKIGAKSFVHLVTTDSRSDALDMRFGKYTLAEPNLFYIASHIGSWDYEIGSIGFHPNHANIVEERMKSYFRKDGINISTYEIQTLEKVSNYPLS